MVIPIVEHDASQELRTRQRHQRAAGPHDLECVSHASIVDNRQRLADIPRAVVEQVEHILRGCRLLPGGKVRRSCFFRKGHLGVGRAVVGDTVYNCAAEPLGSGVPDTERLEELGTANSLVVPISSERASSHSTSPSRARRFPSRYRSPRCGRRRRW